MADERKIINELFVYGTLREGQAARSIFEDHIVATRRATMPGKIVAFPDGYPALLDSAEGTVVGEVVRVGDTNKALRLLDSYEGDDFVRHVREATLEDGRKTPCWTYILADRSMAETALPIASGDWVDFDEDW